MDWKIACCGFDCGKCRAYKGNIKRDADRSWVSQMWFKYYGLKIKPEDINCDGCQKPDSEGPRRISMDCRIRSCAVKRKLENCSLCREFPCPDMEKQMSDIEKTESKHRDRIPASDYNDFIKPYLCRKNLEEFGNKFK